MATCTGFLRERIDAGVVHAGRHVERGRDEVLHLVGPVAVALQVDGQVDHRRAGRCRDGWR